MPASPTARSRVRRVPRRASYDRRRIEEILDAGLVAHLSFVHDGHPFAIPMLYARVGTVVYLHGSAASRLVRTVALGAPVCLTVTLIDGLVLARSAFNHSMNYRSVVVLGQARLVEPEEERLEALAKFTERMVPGRFTDVRAPSRQELKATRVLALPLDEASAKVRSGPPVDLKEDYERATWAGVIPLRTVALEPEPDARLAEGIKQPEYVRCWSR
jgi:nitroimidazol reductase NimA-like FMN-containing flavoprotein (pyridoxamine 5'-phosphate oxidase superfamily)